MNQFINGQKQAFTHLAKQKRFQLPARQTPHVCEKEFPIFSLNHGIQCVLDLYPVLPADIDDLDLAQSGRIAVSSVCPRPFILLNLVLSCIAALQAPVIMMSQSRKQAKDRLSSENDYQVNLEAELEIRQLHDKIDHRLARQ